jgi:hypothetical protein
MNQTDSILKNAERNLRRIELASISSAIAKGGTINGAASLLNVTECYLRKSMKKLGLPSTIGFE